MTAMHRMRVALTAEQRRRLAARARAEGVSETAVIRRILDEALGVQKADDERVSAVDETAGLLADAPDWPDWLLAVRGKGARDRLR
jgi:hypothetical protein